MKIDSALKRITVICESIAFAMLILGLIVHRFDYDLAVVFYAVAFGFGIYPLIRLAYEAGRSLPF
jgi:hypothetical protein